MGFSILSVCFKARAPGAKTITTFIRARCFFYCKCLSGTVLLLNMGFAQVQQEGPLCFSCVLLLHQLCDLCRTPCRCDGRHQPAGEGPDAGVLEHAARHPHRGLHHHRRPRRHFLRVLHQWHLCVCRHSSPSGLLLLIILD